jgi:hypothetical protein
MEPESLSGGDTRKGKLLQHKLEIRTTKSETNSNIKIRISESGSRIPPWADKQVRDDPPGDGLSGADT